MERFLVQVNKDGGHPNITENHRYENHAWMKKNRDRDHREVKAGDELLVYCTSNVPTYGATVAYRVTVNGVSQDHSVFELGEPEIFSSPLNMQAVHDLVDQGKLPEEFRGCGQQGFKIMRITPELTEEALSLIEGRGSGTQAGLAPATAAARALSLIEGRGSGTIEEEAYFIDDIIAEGCFLERDRLEGILDRLRNKKNLILQGPPGTGKTWLAKKLAFALIGSRSERRVRPLQFHPNLSYEDFVRGWRPGGDGRLTLEDGTFLKAIEDAGKEPSLDFVVVIEEINRGNPAQIFGEMLTLLEADKRTKQEALALSYPRSADERIHIPLNLYVIGTMNVADRSLALVDLALRRRFGFIDLEPILGDVWRNWVGQQFGIDTAFLADIENRITSLNQTIAEDSLLGPQFRVGHSAVTPSGGTQIENPGQWFRQVVETEIGPLLDEYWFDDSSKARAEKDKLLQGLGS